MEFAEWEPIYERILADFGYDRAGDESIRDRLAALAEPFDLDRLDCTGLTVAVAGAGPSLESDLDLARGADRVFAASTATDRLVDAGVAVDAMVTDLDKNPETGLERTERGEPVVAHAHGDNGDLVDEWLPRYDSAHVLATTQAAPAGPVRNFGGFTDGDRAAFLADALGADALRFPGWDFEDGSLTPGKARKLRWAERLLYLLERRRGERFAVLDGRREAIDAL
ncbi:6-hydroxymethylpterin diphosphokinase MptE-like protein [Halorarum halobium]|uniref:6-hydroxymethylpterin diphosphokinase MptE-like protein n=1 Tax=Halorarum halobium TaxID=3075121 RepID=UPI0028B08D1C|nr:6-hydroxymethylpterin diphosphokinase MptE-like protein [Halobaculum sp. XH14]